MALLDWKKKRLSIGLTQQQVANMLSVHLRTYRRYENYEILPPKANYLKMLELLEKNDRHTCSAWGHLTPTYIST